MRIISKFKDYYDGAAFQLGEVPLYIRDEISTNFDGSSNNQLKKFETRKIISNLLLNVKYRDYDYMSKYDWLRSDLTSIFGVGSNIYLGWYHQSKYYWYQNLENEYKNIVKDYANVIISYITNNREKVSIAPVFYWEFYPRQCYHIIENPVLREYDFAKCVDSFTCATLIDTYISNLAINQDVPQKISDTDMLESKGFSKVFSFRKQKGE